MKKIKIKIIVILLIYSNVVFSQSDIRGIGLTKCSTFYNSSIEEKIIYMSWVSGFISSHNILHRNNRLGNISYDRSIIWLEYYCYKNPKKVFKEATRSFIDEFSN
jgi:hypothetical protein